MSEARQAQFSPPSSMGAMEMRYFEDFYRAISQGEGDAVNLMRLDGVMLARFPSEDAVGKTSYTSDHILHGNVSGTLRERSFIDGQMRIKAAHLVINFPALDGTASPSGVRSRGRE